MSAQVIENAITEMLKGEEQKIALDYVSFMSANEMPPEWSNGVWICCYKNKPVCVMFINGDESIPGPWTIWHSGYDPKYDPEEIPEGEDGDKVGLIDLSVDERLKETAWTHINICGNCGCGRQPGRHTTVFGKEFDNVCTSTLAFTNPDAVTIEYVKQLAELMKLGILKNN